MYTVGKALFGMGILAYGTALCYIGSVTAEILSDLGNAIMLGTAVLLLLGLTKKKILQEDSIKSITPTYINDAFESSKEP
jgi:hypothetical protein